MRAQDQKVQSIAREVGMLFMHKGREYGQSVTVGNFRMEFEYESPDSVAYIEVYDITSKSNRAVQSYTEDFEDVEIDYPQFFDI
jgi:hypothetical protein